jgi:hypothetical protein
MKSFWKITGILLLFLLLLLIVAISGGIIFLKRLDVAKYKPQIIQAATLALGRPVDFKDIGLKVSLAEGIRFHLTDFSVAEDPKFGSAPFASIREVSAGVDILAFIKSRQVSVPNVLISAPHIDIIRNADGSLNVQTIGNQSQKPAADHSPSAASAGSLPAILVNSFKIQDAQVQWIEKSVQPELKLAVSQVALDVQRFSLINPFDFSLEGAILSPQKNLHVTGKVQLNLLKQEVQLLDTNILLDLNQLPLAELRTWPMLQGAVLPEVLEGQIKVHVKEVLASGQGLGKLLLDVSLAEGKMVMQEVAPGISLSASAIHADIKNFGLGMPFTFEAGLAYLHDQPNIHIKGTATVQLAEQTVFLKDTVAQTDLARFSLDRLRTSVAALKDVSLPESLKGDFLFTLVEAGAGPKGLSTLSGNGSLKNGEVKLKELAVPLGVNTDFSLTQTRLNVDPFQLMLGKGQITVKAGLMDYMTQPRFDVSATIHELDLAEILEQKQAPVKVAGSVSGGITAQGLAQDIQSISAEGKFEVMEANLKDINVLKTVLSLNTLPFFSKINWQQVQAKLPEEYQEKLKSEDTEIKKISAICRVAQGQVLVEPIDVQADEFLFSGIGQVGFDQRYSFDGGFKIPSPLSLAMGEGAEDLSYLYDEEDRISLPLYVSGKGAQIPVFDVKKTALDMGKNALRNQGKKELKKALNKFLGGGEDNKAPASSDGQTQQSPPPAENQAAPESQIIDHIFELFK